VIDINKLSSEIIDAAVEGHARGVDPNLNLRCFGPPIYQVNHIGFSVGKPARVYNSLDFTICRSFRELDSYNTALNYPQVFPFVLSHCWCLGIKKIITN